MPIDEDPTRPGGRLLRDRDGALIARYVSAGHDGRAFADLFELGAGITVERALPVVLEELSGHHVAGDEPLGQAIVEAGGRAGRHAHLMSRDLAADPAPPEWRDPPAPPGLTLGPVDRPATDLTPAALVAYPPDHPDNAHLDQPIDHGRELAGLLAGNAVGPLLPCSGIAVDGHGAVVGVVLVNHDKSPPPFGGPWITQVFRGPGGRGAGRALLQRALGLATAAGLPSLGLAVTHGNPARQLYQDLGFELLVTAFTVRVP